MSFNVHFQFSQNQLEYIDNSIRLLLQILILGFCNELKGSPLTTKVLYPGQSRDFLLLYYKSAYPHLIAALTTTALITVPSCTTPPGLGSSGQLTTPETDTRQSGQRRNNRSLFEQLSMPTHAQWSHIV